MKPTGSTTEPQGSSPPCKFEFASSGHAEFVICDQSVERGFRFLKDPLFLASSLFLRNEKRIMALLMVMTLCLLVYAALEHRMREALKQAGQCFPDQKGKPSARPTARWVFECFVGIHVLLMEAEQLILNLKERHRIILDVLGARYWRFYASPPT